MKRIFVSFLITLLISGTAPGDSVTAGTPFAVDNALVRSDGTSYGAQASGIIVDDSDNITGIGAIAVTGSVTAFGGIAVNAALGTDDTMSAITISGIVAAATIAQWQPVYIGSGGTALVADANGSGTFPARGIAAAAYSSTDPTVIVTSGTIRNDAWNWTPGLTLYLSSTVGTLTQTAPSTTGHAIQVIGWAISADIIMVTISTDYGIAP